MNPRTRYPPPSPGDKGDGTKVTGTFFPRDSPERCPRPRRSSRQHRFMPPYRQIRGSHRAAYTSYSPPIQQERQKRRRYICRNVCFQIIVSKGLGKARGKNCSANFFIAVLGLYAIGKRLQHMPADWAWRASSYASCGMAAFWVFERVAAFWS